MFHHASDPYVALATMDVNRPTRNGTYVTVYLASNDTPVWSADCGKSSLVMYTGSTVVFYVPNPPWEEGETYYVLFDSGAVSGNVFCGPESAPIAGSSAFGIYRSMSVASSIDFR